jgi:hypothetical protein
VPLREEKNVKRRVLRFGAISGVITVTSLAVAPAFAAATVSQATAQSLKLDIGGNNAISQLITATNDGTSETRNDTSTVPLLADLLTGNNVLGAGVAPQDAHANADGTSYACAGLAGTGGGIVTVGHSSCDVDKGQPLTLGLGTINLDLKSILGTQGAITGPLHDALLPVTDQLGGGLDDAVAQIRDNIKDTPLGQIRLDGALSVVEADCTANPDGAKGGAEILDTSGDRKLPIRATVPDGSGGTKTLTLVDFDLNMEPRPGGYDLLVDLDKVFSALVAAIEGELDTAIEGQLKDLNPTLVEPVLGQVRDAVVAKLVEQLRDPLLKQLSDNVLKVTLLDRNYGDSGRSVDAKALNVQVLPAAKQFANAALVDGTIGHVTCGPNNRPAVVSGPGGGDTQVKPPKANLPKVPTVVDSGLAGNGDHTARNVLGATAALLLLGGTAGLVGYRRMLGK